MIEKIGQFFIDYRSQIIVTLIILFVTLNIIIVLLLLSKRASRKAENKRASSVVLLLRRTLNSFLMLITLLIILRLWGFDINILLWALAIIAIIVGLSAHKIIHDILMGIVIVFGNYYEVDDIIEINGFKGKVVAIKIRSTHLLNNKGELKIIANGQMSEIINYSRHFSVAELIIVVDFNEPVEQIILILQERLSNLVEVLPQIIEGPNVIGLTDFSKDGIAISIMAKTLSEQHYEVERYLKKTVSEIFKEKNYHLAHDKMVIKSER